LLKHSVAAISGNPNVVGLGASPNNALKAYRKRRKKKKKAIGKKVCPQSRVLIWQRIFRLLPLRNT
jgi:hypothetical protein